MVVIIGYVITTILDITPKQTKFLYRILRHLRVAQEQSRTALPTTLLAVTLLVTIALFFSMSLFGPASPDTQAAPIVKAQEDTLNSKIPDVLADSKPKESPVKLFQSYLTTGDTMFKQAAGDALNNLSMFAHKAESFAQNYTDKLTGTLRVDNAHAQEPIEPHHIQKIAFSENSVPIAHLADGSLKPIDNLAVNYNPTPIQSLTYTIPAGKKEGKMLADTVTITNPAKLQAASTIKAVADSINPDYTNYLLKLANNEGALNPKQRNYNFNDGTASTDITQAVHHGGVSSVDRGIFQINNKAFPKIPDSIADDPQKATMWAISLIDAGKQSKWVANQKTKDTKVTYE